MDIKLERLEGSLVKITGILESEEWKGYQDKALARLVKEVEVKGFRKGQAPLALAKQHVDGAKVFDEALNNVLQEAYGKAVTENKLSPIDEPDVRLKSLLKLN